METTAILSQVLGGPIEYVRVTTELLQPQPALFGATPDVQQELGQLFCGLGDPDGVYATA